MFYNSAAHHVLILTLILFLIHLPPPQHISSDVTPSCYMLLGQWFLFTTHSCLLCQLYLSMHT